MVVAYVYKLVGWLVGWLDAVVGLVLIGCWVHWSGIGWLVGGR